MAGASAITIGNFDGVHLGHAALLRSCREAVGAGGAVVAVTFNPHPSAVLRPESPRPRLCRPERKKSLLVEAGATRVIELETTRSLLALDPDEFVRVVLAPLGPRYVIEGADFRFGRGRAGSLDDLHRLGREHGFEVIVQPTVEIGLSDHAVIRVSSSMVRWLLEAGRVEDAARCLGRSYEIEGPVESGDRRGRRIGFPTANVNHGPLLLPADGVYGGRALLPDGRAFRAAISVGTKPTYGESARTCEAYLLDYDGPVDDYGWTMRLRFDRWVRDQVAFSGTGPLVAQLERDIRQVREQIPLVSAHAIGVTS